MSIPYFLSTGYTTLKVTRYSGSGYVNGRWSDGTVSYFSLVANVQPTTLGNMTKLLPEGDRGKKSVYVFTRGLSKQTTSSVEGTMQKGDEFVWAGDTYEVRDVQQYEMGVLDHQMCLAVRKEKA